LICLLGTLTEYWLHANNRNTEIPAFHHTAM
jgi:hypothetical protein